MSEVEAETFDEVDLGAIGPVGEVTPEDSGIDDFISAIQKKEFSSAETQFNGLVSDRLQDTLDQAKARIAGEIYNDAKDPVEN